MASESREPSVSESSEAKESEPSDTAVSIPTNAISQQGAGQQSTCEAPPTPNCRPTVLPHITTLAQDQKYWEDNWGPDPVGYDHGGEERPGKRGRVMDNGHHGINMSAPMALPNQHGMPAEHTIGAGQLRQIMPNMQGLPPNIWHQFNMGVTYPGPTAGHHGAQNSTNLFIDHNDTQVNYRDFTGPGLVQNYTNSFISHGAARPSHSTVNGHGGAQKRKHPGL